MMLKWIFDKLVSLLGLLVLWPVLLVVTILIKIKMPGGPAFFVQKRVGKDGKLFNCHKFRTMTVNHNGSTVSVAGDSRITPLGAKLRHYKLDELNFTILGITRVSFLGTSVRLKKCNFVSKPYNWEEQLKVRDVCGE